MAGERALLGVMIHVRSRMEAIAERVSADDFWHPPHRRLFGALLSQGAEATPERLAAVLEEEDLPILEELLEEHASVSDVDSTIEGSVAMLRVRELDARLAAIDREMPLATDAEKDQLMEEKGRLRRQIEDLGGVGMRFGKSRR
jgi:replicative DNA helicase